MPLIKLISKSKTNKVEKYKTAVKVYEGGLPLKTDHVFILNFCEGQFPKVYKEDSYFDDDLIIFDINPQNEEKTIEKNYQKVLTTSNTLYIIMITVTNIKIKVAERKKANLKKELLL